MEGTADRGEFAPDRIDAAGVLAAGLLVVLVVGYSILSQRILLGILGALFVVILVGGSLVGRRVLPTVVGRVEPDRIDAAGLGVAAVVSLPFLAWGVLAQAIFLALVPVAFVGAVTVAALAVRRLV